MPYFEIANAPIDLRPRSPRMVTPPDLSLSDLAERLQLATNEDTCKGMFFNGLLSATKSSLGTDAQMQVQAMMPEKKYVDFFNYPVSTFLSAAFGAAKLLESTTDDFTTAMRKLGTQAIDDFLATPVGRTLITVSGGDVKRLMRAAPIAYRTAVSYGTRETLFSSDTSCIFKMRRDFMPTAYHEGITAAVLRAIGCEEVLVRGERLAILDADYFISWR